MTISIIYWYAHLGLSNEKEIYKAHYALLATSLKNAQEDQLIYQRYLRQKENPQWIEWNLMHRIGLVPKGATKYIISQEQYP